MRYNNCGAMATGSALRIAHKYILRPSRGANVIDSSFLGGTLFIESESPSVIDIVRPIIGMTICTNKMDPNGGTKGTTVATENVQKRTNSAKEMQAVTTNSEAKVTASRDALPLATIPGR
mmetsp:Transcript_185/g.294  ORF Transcript_185/g.294 Transcript_185/m.294 type:complete len:120 (-) Transcript_185:1884-2243(-)|eukprot:7293353-Ditylum_brightwellii.AAC.1